MSASSDTGISVCLLASGSRGNAICLQAGKSRILLDAGLSAREIDRRLRMIGLSGEDLDALMVSHEHSDHCTGLGPMSRRFSLPVHMNEGTRKALTRIGKIDEIHEFETGEAYTFRDMCVHTVPLTHDAADPVGFVFETNVGNVGVLTDCGISTRLIRERFKRCRILVIESNHDLDMLRDGPYPPHLKQRIRSNHGHLSNNACADLLADLLWDGLEAVFLAHLSETNNDPKLALRGTQAVLQRQNLCNPKVVVGTQSAPSVCISV